MRTALQGWLVVGLLLGTMAYAIAEEFTLTTYYPSPRGVYDELRVGSPNVTAPAGKLNVVGDGTSVPFKVEDSPSDASPFIILGNGNVGIGIANPTQKLEVDGNIFLNNPGFLMFDTAYSIFITGSDLGFRTGSSGAAAITFTSAGDVGIGTTAPAARLDVNGTVAIRGGSPGVGKVLSSDATGSAVWDYPKYAP